MGRTIYFKNKPSVLATSSISGPKEGEGSLKNYIETILEDDMFGEKTFEKAESKFLYHAIKKVIKNSNLTEKNIDCIIAGDLLNQIISSTFASRNFSVGYLGVYNACATFTESIILGSTFVDGGYLNNVICGTSSHFSSAERQYRYPLELGSTRSQLAQWTVTGAGTLILSNEDKSVKTECATIGKIVDFGVKDPFDMGAAMAPSASDTLVTHFKDTGRRPKDYDLIVTGDLGAFGSRIFKDLMWEKGYDVENQHVDCGELIYNIKEDEYQGGSGAGCSSVVFCSYLYKKLKDKSIKRLLLMSTGALLSSVSSQQGESIPGITHAVSFISE